MEYKYYEVSAYLIEDGDIEVKFRCETVDDIILKDKYRFTPKLIQNPLEKELMPYVIDLATDRFREWAEESVKETSFPDFIKGKLK